LHRAVIVAVVAVLVVQPTVDDIIVVVAVRNHRMPTSLMVAFALRRVAAGWIRGAHLKHVFVIVPVVGVM